VATGATAKRLGIPSEQAFWSKGISACAICDGVWGGVLIVTSDAGGARTPAGLQHWLVEQQQLQHVFGGVVVMVRCFAAGV
jgi:hypothetical protein